MDTSMRCWQCFWWRAGSSLASDFWQSKAKCSLFSGQGKMSGSMLKKHHILALNVVTGSIWASSSTPSNKALNLPP
eukprot:944715-Amphidinium_carterae.1